MDGPLLFLIVVVDALQTSTKHDFNLNFEFVPDSFTLYTMGVGEFRKRLQSYVNDYPSKLSTVRCRIAVAVK